MRINSCEHNKGRDLSVQNYSQKETFIIFLSLPIAAFLMIYSAPVDVLDQWEWARVLCEEVWRLFPAVKRDAINSTFPQVRQFGICLITVLMPVQAIVYLIAFAARSNKILLNIEASKDSNWVVYFLIASAGFVFIFQAAFLREPQAPLGKAGRLMETHRFSAAFTDSGLLVVIPVFLSLIVFSVIGIIVDFSKKRG